MPDALALTIVIPYSPAQVPLRSGTVSLLPNEVRRAAFGRPYRQVRIAEGEHQLYKDAWALMMEAIQDHRTESIPWPEGSDEWVAMQQAPGGPLRGHLGRLEVSVEHRSKAKRQPDADGIISALKHAFDGMAKALGMDDARFSPVVTVRQYGGPETRITVRIIEEVRDAHQ